MSRRKQDATVWAFSYNFRNYFQTAHVAQQQFGAKFVCEGDSLSSGVAGPTIKSALLEDHAQGIGYRLFVVNNQDLALHRTAWLPR